MGREKIGIDQGEPVSLHDQPEGQPTVAIEEVKVVGAATVDLTGEESEPAVDGGDPVFLTDLAQDPAEERAGGEVLEELIEGHGEGSVETRRLLELLETTSAVGDTGQWPEFLPDEAEGQPFLRDRGDDSDQTEFGFEEKTVIEMGDELEGGVVSPAEFDEAREGAIEEGGLQRAGHLAPTGVGHGVQKTADVAQGRRLAVTGQQSVLAL